MDKLLEVTSAQEAFGPVLVVVFIAYYVIVFAIEKSIAKSKSRKR